MIIGKAYKFDNNELLKDAQHELYRNHVFMLFAVAKSKIIQADAILDANLLITEKVKEINRFDHRVLQDAHDIIAAAYRYHNDDGGQMNLLHLDEALLDRYKTEWAKWFSQELVTLLSYPRFIRSVVESVVFSNSELGYAGQHAIGNFLITLYNLEDWADPNDYIQVYGPDRV